MEPNRLVNLLGTIYMDGYDPNRNYPQVDAVLTQLQNATPQVIAECLSARDTEGNDNTPLMYASIYLRTPWIQRILELALRVEQNSPEGPLHDFRHTLFTHRNAARENVLILLAEAENVESEDTGNLHTDRIRLLIQNGADPNNTTGGQSAQQFMEEQGIDLDWNAMGHLKHKKNKKLVYGKRNSNSRRRSRVYGSVRRSNVYGHKIHAIRTRKAQAR